jgi:cytochrome P450
VYRLIGERRAGGEDRGDLLSMLLAARNADDGSFMTDRQVHDEALTLLMAGHETTANAVAWTWYLLARQPRIYARLREEVDQVLRGRTPAATDLHDLPYTLQVLKESMRMYPPVPVVVREASSAVEIGGYGFPAGTRFIVSPYTLHRRPDLFADPERFDPDRFAPEVEDRLPKGAHLPFVSGPRNCIGNGFALMEGQIVLATLAQRVTFSLVPGQRIVREALITLRPRDGIRMRVERR